MKNWKKNLTPIVFPRKNPLARRVQYCKPCLQKFSRKWSWINEDTKRIKKFAPFLPKNITRKRSVDTQEQFGQLWQSFPGGIQEIFHSKSTNGRTIPFLCRKEISSNRSSGYVECRIDKTDKKIFFDCSKLHRLKFVNVKIWYRSKKEHFFFRMFLWTLGLQFSLSWRKIAAKLSNKICSRSEIEKESTFSKKQFLPGIMLLWTIEMQFWTSCQNVSTKYLEEISALTGKRNDFSERNVFSLKNFLWKRRKSFQNSGQNFSLAVRKNFCN